MKMHVYPQQKLEASLSNETSRVKRAAHKSFLRKNSRQADVPLRGFFLLFTYYSRYIFRSRIPTSAVMARRRRNFATAAVPD